MIFELAIFGVLAFFAFVALLGIRIVRPTERGLIETLGKYSRMASPGFNWIVPGVQQMIQVDITENMVDSEQQEIITKDKLNAYVDAQIYFKIKSDEKALQQSQYNVANVDRQIVSLARTTLRNIIGTLTLSEANSERNKINGKLKEELSDETKTWGIEIVRAELKEIQPPPDVQKAMNEVVKAENQKIAALDIATALETQADGERRASIKKAKGIADATRLQAKANADQVKLEAQAKADSIKLVNEATEKTFGKKAMYLRGLEAVERSLANNTKIVLPQGEKLVNVIGNLAGMEGTK